MVMWRALGVVAMAAAGSVGCNSILGNDAHQLAQTAEGGPGAEGAASGKSTGSGARM
jgi:hypothetical protein